MGIKKRIIPIILSVLVLSSCGSKMDDAVESAETKIRTFLHGQKIYDPTNYPDNTEPSLVYGYYSVTDDGAFLWIYTQNEDDRNLKQEVKLGDVVSLRYDARIFSSNSFDNATTFYTNIATRIEEIVRENTEFKTDNWPTTPLVITVGNGEILEAVDNCLAGARKDDELRIFLPPDIGYGNKGNGSVLAYSTLAYKIIIEDIITAGE